jgi:isopentenyl diphosphate isomerase/L-lactate dehydrogenase-like FMN-dependent dehydrogenase
MPRAPKIYATEDARHRAKMRLPRMIFDFIEGGTGREVGIARNEARFDDICLQSRVMADVDQRSLETRFLGSSFDLPFGIAPMGMCNLAHPQADREMAEQAQAFNMPVCVSSAGSSRLEDMHKLAGGNAWFQLYFGQSAEASFSAVDRARAAGYDTLILTVDVPIVSRRVRDHRNGFNLPFHMTPRAFLDFATHPRWSLSILAQGIPSPQNFSAQDAKFDRSASRAGADWEFLKQLRDVWKGRLIVKGVTHPGDVLRIRDLGIDALYVSNHGARQLDSGPATIDLLPLIRDAVGPEYPLIFDGGLRNGEDVIKALARGANFAMLGRPMLYALAAEGGPGLGALIRLFAEDIGLTMAQLGASQIVQINESVLFHSTTSKRFPSTRLRADQSGPQPKIKVEPAGR